MNRFSLLPFIFLIKISFPVFAEEDATAHRHYIYLGGSAGYSLLNSGVSTEVDKDGYHLEAKGLHSYSWDYLTLDTGFGYLFNQIESTTTSLPLIREEVTTRAVFFELSPRYRFGTHMEVGPKVQTVLGTDVGFGAAGGANHFVMLAGVEGVYKFNFKFPLRLTAGIVTDLNISDRQFFVFAGGIQVGLPIPEVKWTRPAPVIEKLPEKKVRVLLEAGLILFDFNSANLDAGSKVFLEKLGDYLESTSENWKTMIVEGHTDSRGSHAYNLMLSQKRAESVKAAIASQLKEEKRIRPIGYSFDRPKINENNEAAWRANRRVEFLFEGVEDSKELEQAVARIYREVFPKQ